MGEGFRLQKWCLEAAAVALRMDRNIFRRWEMGTKTNARFCVLRNSVNGGRGGASFCSDSLTRRLTYGSKLSFLHVFGVQSYFYVIEFERRLQPTEILVLVAHLTHNVMTQ